jgi:hypothetical protein
VLSTVGSVRARRSVAVLLATAAAAGLGIASAGEASAYTCPSSSTRTISDGSAGMTITVKRFCSDGLSHITGTIRDEKCDGRSAYGQIRFYNGDNVVWYRREWPESTNGCGNSATFSYGSSNDNPRIWAYVYAANGGPTQSSGASSWI